MGWEKIVLLAALGLLLVSAGVEDVRRREIANWKNAAIALAAPLWWWANALPWWPDAAWQVSAALCVFALFAGCFALGWMGGGDVKLIGALALWLPLTPLLRMLLLMSVAGGLVTLVFAAEHRLRRREGAPEIPYGVAIALAALVTFGEPIINRFA